MSEIHRVSRRVFLRDLGRGSLVLAVLGTTAACGDDGSAAGRRAAAPDPTPTPAPSTPAAGLDVRRVPMASGFVSAYVLVRGSEVAIVDTGVDPEDAGVLGTAIKAAGKGWSDVRHVIVTHYHYDHVGSLGQVAERAARAKIYAGRPDIPTINAQVDFRAITGRAGDIVPVGDDDEVFGLQVIETPGHTEGHISVLDPRASVLLVGDAVFNTVDPPRPLDNVDTDQAYASVTKLSRRDFETAWFGHGEPIRAGGSEQFRSFARQIRDL